MSSSPSSAYQFIIELTQRHHIYRRTIDDWRETCLRYHPYCKFWEGNSDLPTRVLQLSEDDGMVHLISGTGLRANYAALSYCWGGHNPMTTTSTTLRQHESGFHKSSMPPLFQDVVSVALCLNIHFLWIDALCIVQDDLSEWEKEAERMADVFSNACITIAATAATNPTMHLLTRKARVEFRPETFTATVDVDGPKHGYRQWDHEDIAVAPLNRRAW